MQWYLLTKSARRYGTVPPPAVPSRVGTDRVVPTRLNGAASTLFIRRSNVEGSATEPVVPQYVAVTTNFLSE